MVRHKFFATDELRGDALEFNVREKNENFETGHQECPLVWDIEVAGTLSKNGNDIYMSGEIKTELSVTCSRCLEPLQFPVKCAVTAHYVPKSEPGKELNLEFSDDVQLVRLLERHL